MTPDSGNKEADMKPKVTWVLIADGAHAKLFENGGPGKGLVARSRIDPGGRASIG